MNRLLEYSTKFKQELNSIYSSREIDFLLFLLINHYLGFSKIEFLLNKSTIIDEKNLIFLNKALTKLKSYYPIQQITGKTTFYGFTFKVNQHVLIPRPETEELVRWVEKDVTNKTLKVIDICAGSGCIGISLKKTFPDFEVTLLDVSTDALEVARENAFLNSVEVKILEKNILIEELDSKYDLIVSNPPYIKASEKVLMNKNVLDFEPHLALFVEDNNPLLFYERIGKLGQKTLNEKGLIYFEINEALGHETVSLLTDLGYNNVELKKDLNGKYRMVKGVK